MIIYNQVKGIKVGDNMIKCRLRVLLAEKEMNQKELAEKTGIQPMTINKMYNNNIVRVPLDAVDKVCEVLQCEISDLFKREETKINI